MVPLRGGHCRGEQRRLGLPALRCIMILETAQSCCGTAQFKDTIFMVNDDASGDLTSGWTATKYVITGQTQHSVGCPSIRHGTDGYYCERHSGPSPIGSNVAETHACVADAVTGMGKPTLISGRERSLEAVAS